jgi:hypothetical protein
MMHVAESPTRRGSRRGRWTWGAGSSAALAVVIGAAGISVSAQGGVFAVVSKVDSSDSCRGSARRPVVSTFSPDRREVAVNFDGLSASGVGAAEASRVECRVSFDVQAPPGLQGEFKGARYRFAIEGSKSGAELQARHGQRRLVMLMRWSLPASRANPGEHAEVIAHQGETLLTACGGGTRVFLDVTLAASSGASVTLDSIEFDAGDPAQFVLTACR